MDRFIGMKLKGRYEIQELIGIGGMANVYKAFDIEEQRTVAVKILREEFLDNADFVRRFKNESKAIGELSHPNIVKIYDVISENDIQSIVMECVDGITLKEYIEYKKILPWREAVHFTTQILRALQHAHDHGIIHRDIKPQNIMLLSDRTIKVMDFGIARFSRNAAQTMTDKAIGSVHYISPEQARGDSIDDKADIYSVGVMLFEMLTGKLPFEADSPVSVAIKQIQSIPTRPREINKDIPIGIEEITLRAMQKDSSQRYQSAAEMLKDLEIFKHNPEVKFNYKYFVDENPTKHFDSVVTPKSSDEKAKGPQKPLTTSKKDDSVQEKNPVVPILTGVAAAFILVAIVFVIGMFVINNPFKNVAEFEAPTLIGQKIEEIKANAEYMKKFKIVEKTTGYNDQFDEGIIYDQKPPAGRKIKEGSVIEVSVSIGKKAGTMPTLRGKSLSEAKSILSGLGMNAEVAQIFDPTIGEGQVVKTVPDSGSEIKSGDSVTVYVSRGTQEKAIKVPDLSGIYNENDIRRVLIKYGLELGEVTEKEGTLPSGTVMDQSPAAGTEVQNGTKVNVTVSKKPTDKKVEVAVELPRKIKEYVTVQAYLDNKLIEQELINPSETTIWKPVFTGKGTGTVIININNMLYKQYSIDFGTGEYKLTKDNSAAFDKPNQSSTPSSESSKPENSSKPAA